MNAREDARWVKDTIGELQDEVARLRAAGQALIGEMWEDEYGTGYTTTGRAYKEAHAVFFEAS